MNRVTGALAAGVGLGAGLMYYLDPDRGSRRRTHARNQVIHASHSLRDNARAQLYSLRQASETDDDRVVAERVRAMLGRVVSHAHALALDVSRGVVTVSGPILRDEVRLTVKALKRVPGVQRVVNALQPHPAPHRMPALQGDRRLAWGGRINGTRRVVAALAGVAGIGLATRAALHARSHEIDLRS